MTAAAALALTRRERASGVVTGADDDGAGGLPPPSRRRARDTLAEALLLALLRPPCLVSFSGGRDSSAVLALATATAREHGLDPPVPVTLRFPHAPTTVESEWQEAVVAHLRLRHWEVIVLGDELDHLGDVARRGLRRHGLLWPANAHFHAPVFARATGGSVLTGLDGDGLLGWDWAPRRAALAQPGPVHARDVLRAGLAIAPAPIRAARYRRRPSLPLSWLRAAAAAQMAAELARDAAGEPIRWDRRVAWYARRRYLRLGVHSLGLLAAEHDVRVVHPLLDPGFLAAFAAEGGRGGVGDAPSALRHLCGDLLPEAVLTRRTKAEFGAIFWGPRARAFAADWDGTGADRELVDAEALRAVWAQVNPPLNAATVMQAAWLGRSLEGPAAPAHPHTTTQDAPR